MDGLTATTILKQDPATASIPVIALSALAMKADEERSQTAGCDAYIVKPLRYRGLYAVLDSFLMEPHPGTTPGSDAGSASGSPSDVTAPAGATKADPATH
jgi:two-component system cell cycle response regulator DivK